MAVRPGVVLDSRPDAEAREPGPVELSQEERAQLLGLARLAVAVAVGARPLEDLRAIVESGPIPDRPACAFVTLTEAGDLRGCMGTLDEEQPAWRSVVEAAATAARGDPRFDRVEATELPWIRVEVSLLGPKVPLRDPAAFRPGVHGIVVRCGARRGLLLPEVAGMLEPRHNAMLDAVCRKAGLPTHAWRDPGTQLAVFRTYRFGGPVLAEPRAVQGQVAARRRSNRLDFRRGRPPRGA